MSYVENVIKATGGHAAPEETLEAVPEGYHRMPDGTIMKDSEHEDEAALEKSSDDPCWEGYVQVGMKKGKNGDMVPNCVPIDAGAVGMEPPITREAAEFIVSGINENYGEARRVSADLAYKVASMATEKYSDLYGDSRTSAVVRELIDFTEYATSGLVSSGSGISCSCYSDLLPEGHPDNETSSIVASALWLSGAPELEEGSREALYASLTALDEIESLHSSYRVKALIASGTLSEHTMQQLKRLSN